MTQSNIENIIESIVSGKTSSMGSSGYSGMEGSRFPRQKINELLEELGCSTGKFSMRGNEQFGNSSERFNVRGLGDEELKEILFKLLSKEGSTSMPWFGQRSPFGSSFHAHHQPSTFLNTYSFNKIHLLGQAELKQFVRMWIKQITVDLITKEFPSIMSTGTHDQPINVDKLFVKKVLIKFVDLVECSCEKYNERQAVMDVLRQIDVYDVIEQALQECKVWSKVYGSCGTSSKGFGGDDLTELLTTLVKEVLRRREGGYEGSRWGQRGDRMESSYENISRKPIAQLIEMLMGDEETSRYRRGGNLGRMTGGYGDREEIVGELLRHLLGRRSRGGFGEDEEYSGIHNLLNKLKRSGNYNEEQLFNRGEGRMESVLQEILGDRSFGSRNQGGQSRGFGSRNWENVNPKVESLIDMLRYI